MSTSTTNLSLAGLGTRALLTAVPGADGGALKRPEFCRCLKRGAELPGMRNNLELEYYAAVKKNGQALHVLLWNPVQGIFKGKRCRIVCRLCYLIRTDTTLGLRQQAEKRRGVCYRLEERCLPWR